VGEFVHHDVARWGIARDRRERVLEHLLIATSLCMRNGSDSLAPASSYCLIKRSYVFSPVLQRGCPSGLKLHRRRTPMHGDGTTWFASLFLCCNGLSPSTLCRFRLRTPQLETTSQSAAITRILMIKKTLIRKEDFHHPFASSSTARVQKDLTATSGENSRTLTAIFERIRGTQQHRSNSMSDDRFPPPGIGESTTRRGEDIAKSEHEEGSVDLGKDEAGRPAGGSTARMGTGVDPKDPVDPTSPNLRPS